jgi:cytochrome oxidase assembly protein ShyY1
MLLNAYAFATIGTIMLWGAIASFIGAIAMSVLVGLGFWHARRAEADEPLLAPKPAPVSS